MTLFNPIWRVSIDGTNVTNSVLASMTITSGRTNIYEQAQAGYVNISLINLDHSLVDIEINNSITVELQNSAGVFIPIFGGNVVDFSIAIKDLGEVNYTQEVGIIALGALARLPKALTNGVLSKAYDGNQIYTILGELLLQQWNEVPAAEQWQTFNPATTWATAGNLGIGEIDRPGDYELSARTSSRTDIYSLVSALATSGLGYIYEDAQGRISYADSTHRTQYLTANGYVSLSAAQALGSGLVIQTRAGDVRNQITLKYKENGSSEVTALDMASMSSFGTLAQIINTTVDKTVDATSQANFYLSLRAYPQANFNSITYELTNPDIDDSDRDSLISIFMGMPVQITNLPLNMTSGEFLGFVEGWTFSARYNQVSVTMNVSPIAYSLQAMRWENVPITERWNTINPTLDWASATQVA